MKHDSLRGGTLVPHNRAKACYKRSWSLASEWNHA